MAGVFITRGMTVSIPAGGLKISLGADAPSPSVTLHVHFDVCPTWCELAMAHLQTAKSGEADRKVAWQAAEETENVVNEKARTLEREFESSMQAIMAAAIALDAFYAVLQPHVGLEPELLPRDECGERGQCDDSDAVGSGESGQAGKRENRQPR